MAKITVWGLKKIAWVTKWGLLDGHLVCKNGLSVLFWPPKRHFRCPRKGQNFPVSDQQKKNWHHLFYLGDYYTQKRDHSLMHLDTCNKVLNQICTPKKYFVNNVMLSSVSSSGLFPRGSLSLHPGPTDLWGWLRRRLWRLWCLSQSIKGPSHYHFQRSHCWLLIIFFFSLCRVRQVVQATDLRTCWRWELESLKALWPSSTTRWTFSSPSSQTRWWFTQYTNNGDEHISD